MFGKVVGGGLPLAALGGRADVMDELAPLGPVYQAGTLSGNPLATAAGLAVLARARRRCLRRARRRARTRFADGLRDALGAVGAKAHGRRRWPRSPACSSRRPPVTNYDEAQAADHERYARFFHALLDTGSVPERQAGVFFPPSGYEAMFVSLAHGDRELADTVDAVATAARATAEFRPPSRSVGLRFTRIPSTTRRLPWPWCSVPATARRRSDRGRRSRAPDLGQHFLASDALAARIVDDAGIGRRDRVVEPGAGTGVLTAALAARSASVLASEIDARLAAHVAARFADLPHVTVLNADATSVPRQLSAYRVVGNPAFNSTTALLRHLLDHPSHDSEHASSAPTWWCSGKWRGTAPRSPTTCSGPRGHRGGSSAAGASSCCAVPSRALGRCGCAGRAAASRTRCSGQASSEGTPGSCARRSIAQAAGCDSASTSGSRATARLGDLLLGVVVLGEPVARTWSMKNSAPPIDDDHHRHEHERQATASRSSPPASTSCWARGRSGREDRHARDGEAVSADEEHGRGFARMVRPFRDRVPGGDGGGLLGLGRLLLVPLTPVEHEQTEHEQDRRDDERDERRDPQRAEVAGEDHEPGLAAVGAHSGGNGGRPNGCGPPAAPRPRRTAPPRTAACG